MELSKNNFDVIIKRCGYLRENITISDITISSIEHYKELYKSSNGSYSDFREGWCLFYTPPFTNDKNKQKGTMHRVKNGVSFPAIEIEKTKFKKN